MKTDSVAGRIQWALLLLFLQAGMFGQTPNERVQAITSALQERDFAKALQSVQSALQSSPNNPQLWMFQGLAYAGENDSKSALASYKHAIRIAPDYLPALEGAAQIEYEAGSAEAIPLLQHVLKLRPDDVTSNAMLTVLAEKNGDCATAVEHYVAGEHLLDTQPFALQGYGACLLKLNQTDKAIEVFQQLVAKQPEDPQSRRGLAAVQLATGKPQDALATLQPLLDSAPDVSTLRLAAAAYEANKDTPSAVKTLRDAIVKDPRQVALYVDFAEIAMDHQSFQTGVEMIDSGLKLQPNAAPLYLARGVLYVQLADYEKAGADFERAEALDPKQGMNGAAQSMLAEEQNQSDPSRALATVRAKLVKQPGEAFLWYLQAAILSQKSPEPGSAEFQQGLDSAKKAVTLQPSLTAAHNVLAKYYLDSSQNELAAKECRIVLEKDPSDQSALYHLVIALRKTNSQAEIPDLLKRLAKARQQATRQEGERNRYKLVIAPPEPAR
ncbi:MAG TPA: tetratricopeptide repeat protein [Terracidiphilus sp.]|jgi:tetratricopeptide (TPR) repeat protein|nr:tetratricopeptide repeat protein [Terracidiphilus sp.]